MHDLTLERALELDLVTLFEKLGCTVIRFSERRRTRITPGVADLKVYCPARGASFWMEVKTLTGKQSDEQRAFEQLVRSCGEQYVCGGMEAALQHLRAIGRLASRAAS